MGILRNLSLLTGSLLLTGCYEDFIPAIDVKPVLCLNSLITAGQPVTVEVTHTRLYTDVSSDSLNVEDATVTISVNGKPVDESYVAKEGDHVHIEAESAVYGHAEAEVDVPYGVPVAVLDIKPTATYVSGNMVYFDLKAHVEIKDPAEKVNYYSFSWRAYGGEEQGVVFNGGVFHEENEPIFSEHIGALEGAMGETSYGSTFFTDRQFSGKSYKLSLNFTGGYYLLQFPGEETEDYDCGYDLKLHVISQSYYSWKNYLWQVSEGMIGDLAEIGLADPMGAYSNVSTGAGIVAAQSISVVRIRLDKFLQATLSAN